MTMPEAPQPQLDSYATLTEQLESLLADETDPIANLANAAALIYQSISRLNWAGFYLLREGELVLGPFQGGVACTRIAIGRGVCGTSAERRESVLVDDVHKFPGHIACDPVSRSELVVPVVVHGELLGVLDLDSPLPARFSERDRVGLESVVQVLQSRLEATT